MGATDLTLHVDQNLAGVEHPVYGKDAYAHAALVGKLGVLQRAYVTLQAREAATPKASPLKNLTLDPSGHQAGADLADAIEAGLFLARDIGSGDPERMTPLRLAEAVVAACEGVSGVQIDVISDVDVLRSEYPLLFAVARASISVERHRPCVVRLEWSGSGETTRTVVVAGKGVTYDTGGADLKVGGSMPGMRRDKCGAAAAAGFFLSCVHADPKLTAGLKVVVELGCVRNSIGPDAFVPDEIIVGHSGRRVLIGNTDAEGRLVLADVLSHLRDRVTRDRAAHPNPTLVSLATLTGHAVRCFGNYATAIDNMAAKAAGGVAPRIASAGARLGQPLEVSVLRKEDYAFIAPGAKGTPVAAGAGAGEMYDVLQCNNGPSSTTTRGHQFPMALLDVASGLSDHGAASCLPLPYCHIDLADSIADERGIETGSPIVPLFGRFVLGLD
jgi:leucyl aminopeptidase